MLRRNGLLPSMATAFLLAIGFLAVWYVACSWGGALLHTMFSSGKWSEVVQVTKDGHIVLSHRHTSGANRLTDLDGNEIARDAALDVLRGASLAGAGPMAARHVARDWSHRVVSISDEQPTPTFWYFIHDGESEGSGYFEGFNSETNRHVGYLGTSGFAQTMPPRPEQFAVNGRRVDADGSAYSAISITHGGGPNQPGRSITTSEWGRIPGWFVYLASGDTLYEIDLRNRSVASRQFADPIISVGKIDRVVSKQRLAGEPLQTQEEVVLRMRDRLLTLAQFDDEPTKYSLPQSAASFRGPVRFFLLPGDELLSVGSQWEDSSRYRAVLQTTPSGEAVMTDRKLVYRVTVGRERSAAAAAALMTPVPLMTTIWTGLTRPQYHQDFSIAPSYRAALAKTIQAAWPVLLLMAATSLLSAWLIRRRQQRYAAGQTTAWTCFGLFLGLPGWLAYRFHRRWPSLASCRHCGANTPQDRARCASCDSESPEPELLGVEVFA